MKLETTEILKNLNPFRNGCSFRTEWVGNDVKLFTGCYHLINLQTGSGRYLQGLCGGKGYTLDQVHIVDHIEEVKVAILTDHEKCSHCDNELHNR